ncbi:MAG: hypothetical protein U9N06_01555 [candidate division WOR-3 bacterium]|nr:hypothetical protein [candidate division WOR-3 bacterium]
MVDEVKELEKEISPEGGLLRNKILRVVVLFILAAILIAFGIHYRWDKRLIGIGIFLFGLVSEGWSSLIGLLGSIPVVGHIIIKFIALPLLFIVNGVGNVIVFLAIKMGYKKEVVDTKLLAWTFAGGILLGFIVGELL